MGERDVNLQEMAQNKTTFDGEISSSAGDCTAALVLSLAWC